MLTSSIITYITIHLISSISYNFIYSFDTISFYKSLYNVFRYKPIYYFDDVIISKPSIDTISILFNSFNCKIKLKLKNSRVLS